MNTIRKVFNLQCSIFNFVFLAINYSLFITHCSLSSWYWQQPLPTGNLLYSIHFPNSQTGYAAGILGTIIKTTDGGTGWNLKNSGTSQDLYEIFFIDSNTGIAVGKTGTILRTTDAANNWQTQISHTTNFLHDVTFPNANTGYVVGLNGTILKTTDKGINWIQLASGTAAALFCVSFLNVSTGVAGGFNVIIKTTNGGINWINQNVNIFPSSAVVGISQTDNNTIIAAGNSPNGAFYKTSNAGINWLTNSLSLPLLFDGSVDLVRSSCFINSNTGFIVTDFGTILHTTNGGNNWTGDSSFRPSKLKLGILQDVTLSDFNSINIAGGGGTIIRSSNAGLNWVVEIGNKKDIRGSFFINSKMGYCAGEDGMIMRTNDEGATWKTIKGRTEKFLNSVFFINEATGYTAGDSGTILMTTNSGRNWKSQFSNITAELTCIHFINKDTGIAAGGNESNNSAIIIRTTNGGDKWNLVFDAASSGSLKSVDFINETTGIIVGEDGNVLRTTNAGIVWNLSKLTVENLNSFCFADSLNGLIAGTNGRIFKTTNSGIDWFTLNSGIFKNLFSIKCLDYNYAIVGGENGTIIETTNGGINWILKPRITDNTFYAVNVTNKNNLFALGEFGTIIRTSDANTTFENNYNVNLQNEYKLFQNYPNPFNASTVISYQLGVNSFTSLKIYDAMGKEVATLVNEKQKSGSYNYQLSTFNYQLSSGIYFYRLIADGIVIGTKSMVMIK